MESLPLIKLLIDLALAGTVLYLAIRVVRGGGPSAGQVHSLQALEASLARLLKDAGGASNDLELVLKKEQKKLEELLYDIESVEHRVNKGLDEVQAAGRELKRAAEEAKTLGQQVTKSPVQTPQPSESYVEQPVQRSQASRAQAPQYADPSYSRDELENYDNFTPEVAATERRQEEAERSTPAVPSPQGQVQYNIYGEPIESAPSLPQESVGSPLRREIERELNHSAPQVARPPMAAASSARPPLREQIQSHTVAQPPATRPPVQQSLEEIYAKCEQLLKAGSSIQQVSALMNLSVDEIETLQNLMMVEDEPASVTLPSHEEQPPIVREQSAQDARLGVLSKEGRVRNPIGRTTQVVS